MESCDKIRKYKEEVCNQIRWKKAHEEISKELEAHIIDQKEYYLQNGEEESIALERAIEEMGDPIMVGTQLDRTHRPKPQKAMLALTMVLVGLGLFIHIILLRYNGYAGNVHKHILAVLIGAIVLFCAYYLDFTIISRYPKAIMIGSFLMMSGFLLFDRRLIMGRTFAIIMTMPFSGAYLSLLFPLILVVVIYITRKKGYLGIMFTGIVLSVMSLLVLFFSTPGTMIVFLAIGLILLTVSICKGWYDVNKVIACLGLYATGIIGLVFVDRYHFAFHMMNRLKVIFNPSLEPYGNGYAGVMIRELLKKSTLFGSGFIPEYYENLDFLVLSSGHTDFLLIYLIVKYGRIALYIIAVINIIFLTKGFYQSFKQKSMLGFMVSLAVMLTLAFETIIYIAWNLGLLLVSPISLPLISYGNTALLINLFLIGIMLSVFRTGDIAKDEKLQIINLEVLP